VWISGISRCRTHCLDHDEGSGWVWSVS
jgi:hypothetical protein